MIYVMSDPHGCLQKWETMLKEISFSDADHLYILGDIIDRGKKPITLLQQIMQRENIHCVMGNHELQFLRHFAKLLVQSEYTSLHQNNLMAYMTFDQWRMNDGQFTCREFTTLSLREQKQLLQYIAQMPLCQEIALGDTRYLLTHSGLNNFLPDKPLNTYSAQDFLEARPSPDATFFTDKMLLFGHTPTFLMDSDAPGKIYYGNGWINLDCGAVFPAKGGTLACLRLDDGAVFYV